MAEACQRGLELFGQGPYQEAICRFEASLQEAETIELQRDRAPASQ
jgi:hypothetical protein